MSCCESVIPFGIQERYTTTCQDSDFNDNVKKDLIYFQNIKLKHESKLDAWFKWDVNLPGLYYKANKGNKNENFDEFQNFLNNDN